MNRISSTIMLAVFAVPVFCGCAVDSSQNETLEPAETVTQDQPAERTGEASAAERIITVQDCKDQYAVCFNDCYRSLPPGTQEFQKDEHIDECVRRCKQQLDDCKADVLRKAIEREQQDPGLFGNAKQWVFDTLGAAKNWLVTSSAVVVGAVVLVGGVVYQVVKDNAGVLVLMMVAG